jgi:hypothetical protein
MMPALITTLFIAGTALSTAACIISPAAIPALALVGVGCGFMMRAWEVANNG